MKIARYSKFFGPIGLRCWVTLFVESFLDIKR
jgi:hypothetical protein